MFERFTDRARRVVVEAQHEARTLGHDYIGTEHLLLGLLAEGSGVASKALEALGVGADELRERVEATVGRGQAELTGHIPFTPPAKRALKQSLAEALRFGHNYIGTEHLLLGLIQEQEGVAARALADSGADLKRVRAEVGRLLADYHKKQQTPPGEADSPGGAAD